MKRYTASIYKYQQLKKNIQEVIKGETSINKLKITLDEEKYKKILKTDIKRRFS